MATPPQTVDGAELESEILSIGRELSDRFPSPVRHPIRAIDERAMRLSSRDRELRAALFRLVDVTPACRSLDELAAHLTAFASEVDSPSASLAAAMGVAHTKPGRVVLGAAVATGVRHTAHRFIAGATAAEAMAELGRLWRRGIASSLDLLGEATVTRAEAEIYAERCAEALAVLGAGHAELPGRAGLERDPAGSIPRANLSIKVTALTPLIRAEAPRRGVEDGAGRLRALLQKARDVGAHLHVDMESLDTRATTTELLLELLDEPELRAGPSAGLVLQAYLRDSPAQLDTLIDWAEGSAREVPLVVRLVKGAYWDHEIVEARQHGWRAPVFERRSECDRNFEQLTRRLLDHARRRPDRLRVAIGSHNLRSVAHAIAYNRLSGGEDSGLELQVLRGLGDGLAEALAQSGMRVRIYCPVGDLVAGMAYLVRRLLENTANESFLAERTGGTPFDELLAAP